MLKKIIDEEEQAISARDFILKLSGAPNLSQDVAIEAIKNQLRLIEQNRYFAEVFDSLHPDRYDQITRALPDSQKQNLSRALIEYTEDNEKHQ